MITVLLVHQLDVPDCHVLVGLCADHAHRLERAGWVRIDELVGFSSRMDCEACALIHSRAPNGRRPLASEDLWSLPANARHRTSLQILP